MPDRLAGSYDPCQCGAERMDAVHFAPQEDGGHAFAAAPKPPLAERASAKSVLTKLLTENGYSLGSSYGEHHLIVIGRDHERVHVSITEREHDWLDRFTEQLDRSA